MTNVKLIIYLCWAAAVCMENAIDPHHQCCCFKCNLEKHTQNNKAHKCFIYLCRCRNSFMSSTRARCENKIQSPLSDGKCFDMVRGGARVGVNGKPPLMRFSQKRKISFMLLQQLKLIWRLDDCLWIINHDIILLLWWKIWVFATVSSHLHRLCVVRTLSSRHQDDVFRAGKASLLLFIILMENCVFSLFFLLHHQDWGDERGRCEWKIRKILWN